MSFLDEKLALNIDPKNAEKISVMERIPSLKDGGPDFLSFLNKFSDFLQAPQVMLRSGLEQVELKMIEKATFLSKMFKDFDQGEGTFYDWLLWAIKFMKYERGSEENPLTIVNSLLSNTLTDIENRFLFPEGTDRKRAVTLSGLVKPNEFRAKLLQQAKTWKDPNVDWEHGEFTHRLQWCAGMLTMGEGIPWKDFMMKIGTYTDDAKFGAADNAPVFGLWDALADRNRFKGPVLTPYLTENENDFRSPENFQAWLLDGSNRTGESKIKILATFLDRRADWRKTVQNGSKPFAFANRQLPPKRKTWDAWSRTLFNNRLVGDLTPAEKGILARAWYRLTELDNKNQPVSPILDRLPEDQNAVDIVPDKLKKAYISLKLNPDGTPL